MISTASSLAFAGALIAGLASVPAQAQSTRTFVSGHGTDSGACNSVAAPCRTFNYAISQTAASGEIAVLDTAGYGTTTINKAISIVNESGGEASVSAASGATAITIFALASDIVRLRGLTIEGANVGEYGVDFGFGGRLEIENCVVRHFAAGGILLAAPSAIPVSYSISNTIVSDNGAAGIFVEPSGGSTVQGVLSNVTVDNNQSGIVVDVYSNGSGADHITIIDSKVSNNANEGIQIGGNGNSLIYASIINSVINYNGQGIVLYPSTSILSRNTIARNGVSFEISGGSPVVYSYGDNDIYPSTTGILTTIAKQ